MTESIVEEQHEYKTHMPLPAAPMPSKASTAKGHCLIFNKSSIRLSTLEGQVSHFYFWPSDTSDSGDLRAVDGKDLPQTLPRGALNNSGNSLPVFILANDTPGPLFSPQFRFDFWALSL